MKDLKAHKRTRKGKVRRMVIVLFLAGVAAYLGAVGWAVYTEATLPPQQPSEAIVVLGAQVKADGSPSLALERRLTLAWDQYAQNPQLIITCGAQGGNEPAPEGEVMRNWLMAKGIAGDEVVAETNSFNTRENLLYVKDIMAQRGISRVLVVTSDYHVARALALCKQLGIQASGVGSPSEPAYWIKNHAREGMSWIKFWLEGMMFWRK